MAGAGVRGPGVLERIRPDDPDTIEPEIVEIKDTLEGKPGGWRERLATGWAAALLSASASRFCSDLGINPVIYYARRS